MITDRVDHRVASACLILVWVFPLLATVQAGWSLPDLVTPFPTDAGLLDSNRTLLTILCLVAWGLSWPQNKKAPNLLTTLGWGFLGWGFLSSLTSEHPFDSLLFFQTWIAAAAAYAAGRRLFPLPSSFESRFLLIHLPATAVAAVSLIRLIGEPTVDRVLGPFGLANVYSNWLLLFFPLMLLDLFSTTAWRVPASAITSGICLASLLLTQSRGGLLLTAIEIGVLVLILLQPGGKQLTAVGLGFAAILIPLLIFRLQLGGVGFLSLFAASCLLLPTILALRKKQYQVTFRTIICVALAGLAVVTVQQLSDAKISTEASSRMNKFVKIDNSTRTRGLLWSAALEMTNDHPVLGVGPGGFAEAYPQYQPGYYVYSDSPHSTWLEMSSELGWVGFFLFLAWCGATIPSLTKGLRDNPFRSAALLGVVIGAVQAQVDVTYQYGSLWTTLALVAVWASPESQNSSFKPMKIRLVAVAAMVIPLLYLLSNQRIYEEVRVSPNSIQSFQRLSGVVERLPYWSKPSLRLLERGLNLDADKHSEVLPLLEREAGRVGQTFTANPSAHRLQAEVFRSLERRELAKQSFLKSIELDPWNYPLAYYYLIEMCQALGDRKGVDHWVNVALKTYPLEFWEKAHHGHRAKLEEQLIPLFYAVADTLSPYNEPLITEPLYRFVLGQKNSPRALHGLGISLLTQGKVDEAYPFLTKAHQLNPAFPAPPPRR